MTRRRRRSRGSKGGGVSRRRLLALLAGSTTFGAFVTSTGAFTSARAPRSSNVDAAADPNAYLGLSPAPYVDAGMSGEHLVTITNNATVPLTITVSLANASGTVSPSSPVLQPGEDQLFTVDLSEDAQAGENALTFAVTATDGSAVNINLSRSLGVRNFLRRLQDRSHDTNGLFYLTYRLENMDNFQSYELVVKNLDLSWVDDRTFTSTDYEHIFRIPESGTDGGTMGSRYEFTMRIYDTNGLAIERTLVDVADGSDPPDNDNIGGAPNDPQVVDFTITDKMQYTNAHYTVDYEVENLTNLKEVRVTFDDRANNWADATKVSTSAPTGTVTYDQGGVGGHTFDITVETVNNNDIVTDSLTKTDVADGDDL